MANIKSFPNNQDVYIGAEDVMKWLHGRTSGVFASGGNASVAALASSSMAVTVSDGLGWMANAGKDGVVWWIDNEAVNGSKLQLSIDPADGVLNRIDRIIVEWKTTNYVDYPEVKVLKGTASSRATAPTLTNDSTVRQISLAKISVAAGTTAITSSMITDERLDASVCGLVTESVSIDTYTMQKQFEELLVAIQTELKDLNENTASLLKAGGTMYGALDMGGHNVLNVAEPTNENDAVPKKFVENSLKSRLSMELLYENGVPMSEFEAREIKVNLDDCKAVLVSFHIAHNNEYVNAIGFRDVATKASSAGFVGYGGNYFIATYRQFTMLDNKVSFGSGMASKENTDATVQNWAFVPYRIYGIKGEI